MLCVLRRHRDKILYDGVKSMWNDVRLKQWGDFPDVETPEGLALASGRSDLYVDEDARRYRQDWPGPNWDGVGQMHYDLMRKEAGHEVPEHVVFVGVEERERAYCLACGPLDVSAVRAEWAQQFPERMGPKSEAGPRARVKDVELFYELYGEGEPVVFIAGTGGSCGFWREFQVPDFSRNHQVLIYDHRGTGQSDKPDIKYSTRMFADDLASLMAKLDIGPAHVIGHSMGGRVAQWMALEHPDKVRSVILSGTGPGHWPGRVDHPTGLPHATAYNLAKKGFEQYFHDHMHTPFMHSDGFHETERFKRIVELATSGLQPLYAYMRHVAARQEHQTFDILHRIRVPTLVVGGAEDKANDHITGMRYLANKIPGAKLNLLPDLRHGYLREAPEKVNKVLLEWIQNVKTD